MTKPQSGVNRLIQKRASVIMPLHPELVSDSNPGVGRKSSLLPNPLKAIDSVWKKAAGPTETTPKPSMNRYSGPPIQIAGTKRKKSSIPVNKI